jgi:hypothetical protein
MQGNNAPNNEDHVKRTETMQYKGTKLPNLTLRHKIGGTTYTVSSRFNEKAGEDMTAKIRRLILNDANNG